MVRDRVREIFDLVHPLLYYIYRYIQAFGSYRLPATIALSLLLVLPLGVAFFSLFHPECFIHERRLSGSRDRLQWRRNELRCSPLPKL